MQGRYSTFRALRHLNFRLYFIGLLISVTGMWAQTVAQQWLVYELTNSPAIMGQVMFVTAIPVWLLSPWAGVVLDRVPRRTVLVATQILLMVQAIVLAALSFTGLIEVWHIVVLSLVQGIANAFDAPARQSFYVELVAREDLSNAIALNSTLMSLARIVGPSFGGLVVATLGTAWAFTINAVTFLAILVSLLVMRLPRFEREPSGQSPLADMVEGLRFIWSQQIIGGLIGIALAVALFGASFRVLMPVVASDVLGRGEVAFGMLNAASGVGSLLGALLVATLSTQPYKGRALTIANLALPVALAAFAFSRSYPLSLALMVAVGLGLTPQMSLANMLIQSNIPDAFRGRVMAVYTLVIFGTFPLGNLLAGTLAEHLGAPITIALSAVAVMLVALGIQFTVPGIRRLQ